MHPDEKISTIELVFTRLHAGGKFNKDNNSSYNFQVVSMALEFR